jgi:hypothetical protein
MSGNQQTNNIQQQYLYYMQLRAQKVPGHQAYQMAFPNGLPNNSPDPEKIAKEQQKAGLGQIAGGLAGTLGTYYLIKNMPSLLGTAAPVVGESAAGLAGAGSATGLAGSGTTTLGSEIASSLATPQIVSAGPTGLGAATTGGAAGSAALGGAGAAAPSGLLTGASPALYFGAPLAFLGASAALAPSVVKAGRKIALALGIGDKRPEREYNPEIQAMSKNLNLQLPGLAGLDQNKRKEILDQFYAAGAIRMPGRIGEDEKKLELSTEGSSMIIPRLKLEDREQLYNKHGKWNRALPIEDMVTMMKTGGYKQGNPRNQAFFNAYETYKNAMQGGMGSPQAAQQPLGGAISGASPGGNYVDPRAPSGGTFIEPRAPQATGMGAAIQGSTQSGGFTPMQGSALIQALQGALPVNRGTQNSLNSNVFTPADVKKAMEMMKNKGRG